VQCITINEAVRCKVLGSTGVGAGVGVGLGTLVGGEVTGAHSWADKGALQPLMHQ
jgi:hypothetical protein